jgi:hypothetical protein
MNQEEHAKQEYQEKLSLQEEKERRWRASVMMDNMEREEAIRCIFDAAVKFEKTERMYADEDNANMLIGLPPVLRRQNACLPPTMWRARLREERLRQENSYALKKMETMFAHERKMLHLEPMQTHELEILEAEYNHMCMCENQEHVKNLELSYAHEREYKHERELEYEVNVESSFGGSGVHETDKWPAENPSSLPRFRLEVIGGPPDSWEDYTDDTAFALTKIVDEDE